MSATRPASKTELKMYALRRLGYPAIDINVCDEQLDDLIEESIDHYQEYHYNGSYKTFIKIEVTDAIKEHVQLCINKIEHMNHRAVEARVHLERDHVGLPSNKFKCAIHLYFKGADLFAEDYENDLYASIDLVTKKIQSQLRKRHNKIITRHQSGASKAKKKFQVETV